MSNKPEREADAKKDDIHVGVLTVYQKDVSKEMEDMCIAASVNSLKSYYKSEITYFRDIAQLVKNQIDKQYSGAWHVIVGRNFGAFVTHEAKR